MSYYIDDEKINHDFRNAIGNDLQWLGFWENYLNLYNSKWNFEIIKKYYDDFQKTQFHKANINDDYIWMKCILMNPFSFYVDTDLLRINMSRLPFFKSFGEYIHYNNNRRKIVVNTLMIEEYLNFIRSNDTNYYYRNSEIGIFFEFIIRGFEKSIFIF